MSSFPDAAATVLGCGQPGGDLSRLQRHDGLSGSFMLLRRVGDNREGNREVAARLPAADGRTAQRFFRGLEPFFARKHLTYIDIGAHRGDVFHGLLQTELKVREAHLIEPNPRSFRMLAESMAALDGTPPVCHQLALAA